MGIDREQCIKQVNQYIDAHREDMMQFWKELVSIESGNESQKEGVDEICSKIAEELRGCGAETQTIQMEKKAGRRSRFCSLGIWIPCSKRGLPSRIRFG